MFITYTVRCVKYWLQITNVPDERLPKKAYNIVTKCICTLCLCCCTLRVALSMFFRVWTSFNVLRVVILDVTKRRGESAREKARGNSNGLSHIPSKEKKRIKQELLAVAGLLSLISNLLLPSTVYHMLLYLQDLSKKTWACYIKEWLQQNVGHLNRFVSVFKQRLLDQFKQDWSAGITSKERFQFYSIFKRSIQTEMYIDILQLRCFREVYANIRFGISPISVHRLRSRNYIIPRDLLCPLCNDKIEDESHALFSYKAYEDFRKDVSWFSGSHTAAVADVSHVMSADDEMTIWEVSLFSFLFLQSFAEEKQHCNFANWHIK